MGSAMAEPDEGPPLRPVAEEPRADAADLQRLFATPSAIGSVALTGLLVLALLYTLYFARTLVLPIVLALLASFLLRPPVRALARLRIPEPIGAGLVLLALLGALAAGGYFLVDPASRWLAEAPRTVSQIERRLRELREPVERMSEATAQVEELAQGPRELQQVEVKDGSLGRALFDITWQVAAGVVVILVLLYFLLASGDLFLRKVIAVLPRLEDKKTAVVIARRIENDISTYLLTVTAINTCLGVATGLAMWAWGMPNPFLWGVLGGLANFIPYLGAFLAVGVVTGVGILTFDNALTGILVGATYWALTTLEGTLITPMVLGRRLILNPVVVFLSLIIWGWLWGVPGAMLAVPLVMTFKIFCDDIQALAPIGEFLGK